MFVNREKEIKILQNAFKSTQSSFIVVYGRRRCGKSTLLKKVLTEADIYFVADMKEKALQIESFAKCIDSKIEGFSKARYPDWESFFISLNNQLKQRIVLCIDEFPYLVKHSAELPSILQNIIDNKKN